MVKRPFIHSGTTTRVIMTQTVLALVPIVAASLWRSGWDACLLLAAATVSAWTVDFCCDRYNAFDGSAVITGVLFALMLPPSAPWWIAATGAAMAIGIGKHCFGGMGQNLFNPSALARVFMMALLPTYFLQTNWFYDSVAQASPLSKEIDSIAPTLYGLLSGNHPGTLSEAMPAALILGGCLLMILRTIDWQVPIYYMATISLLALCLPASERIAGHAPWLAGNPLLHLAGGGTLLTAFFLLTDPVTSPFTKNGRVLYVIIAGVYTMLIRFYTPYPDSAVFAVLLANAMVPVIDKYIEFKLKQEF